MSFKPLLLTLALAAGLAAGAASAEETIELKFAHWLPPQHPLQPTGIEPWATSVEEASGGTLKVTTFPAQQLGKAKDHYDMARDGIADIAWINPGYQPGRFPVIGAGELPFLVSNAKAGSAALDAWYRDYAEREMADVKVCLVHLHDPGTFHSKQPIAHPDNVQGLKVRPAHATMARFVSLLGGSSVQVPAPEAREALERGVAEAITFPWNSILIFGIDKAVSYHTDVKLYATTFAWVMNKGVYERMSAAQKQVIDQHCTTEWAEKVSSGWADNEAAGRDKLAGMSGHTLVKLSDAQLQAWRDAAQPLRQQWKEQVGKAGVDADKALQDLIEELEARDSAY